jgi:hypothetical protein
MYLAQRERILATDEFLKPIFAAVEFSKMTDHRFLSEDRLLQQSVFTNGATITVNFAESPREYGGTSIPALGYHLQSKNSAMTLAQNMEE